MKYKHVGYAHPTSPLAEKLNHGIDGCYYVTPTDGKKFRPELRKPFVDKQEAFDYAATLPGELDHYSMRNVVA